MMENEQFEELLKDFKSKFKEWTGIDLSTCTEEEYNQWYHDECAKSDRPYDQEILKSAERIIEKKNYPTLVKILENYDQLVKSEIEHEDLTEYPYWCYCFNQVKTE